MNSLPLSRQFAVESQTRAIQNCESIEDLRSVTINLLQAWHLQASLNENLVADMMGLQQKSFGP